MYRYNALLSFIACCGKHQLELVLHSVSVSRWWRAVWINAICNYFNVVHANYASSFLVYWQWQVETFIFLHCTELNLITDWLRLKVDSHIVSLFLQLLTHVNMVTIFKLRDFGISLMAIFFLIMWVKYYEYKYCTKNVSKNCQLQTINYKLAYSKPTT